MKQALRRGGLAVLIVSVCAAGAVGAQEPEVDLGKEIEALKQGQESIRQDLRVIRQLLQARQAPARPAPPSGPDVSGKIFDLGTNPVKGESTAKLTLVEFTDYQ